MVLDDDPLKRPPLLPIRQGPDYVTLHLEGDWEAQASAMNPDPGVEHLILDSHFTQPGNKSLEFLGRWTGIRALTLYSRECIKLQGLYHIADSLESLSVTMPGRSPLDLSRFTRLKSLNGLSGKPYQSVFDCCSLECLYLNWFSSQSASLAEFKDLHRLEWLNLYRANIRSVRGIEALTRLDDLRLLECAHIQSYDQSEVNPWTRRLIFDCCRTLTDIRGVARCPNLEWFAIEGPPALDSVLPLTECARLKRVVITGRTRVTDEQLDVLLSMPNLRTLIARSASRQVARHEVSEP